MRSFVDRMPNDFRGKNRRKSEIASPLLFSMELFYQSCLNVSVKFFVEMSYLFLDTMID